MLCAGILACVMVLLCVEYGLNGVILSVLSGPVVETRQRKAPLRGSDRCGQWASEKCITKNCRDGLKTGQNSKLDAKPIEDSKTGLSQQG